MIHEFRAAAVAELGILDRLCTEPLVKSGRFETERIIHTRFEMQPHGDVTCLHCGERFYATRTGYEKWNSDATKPDVNDG